MKAKNFNLFLFIFLIAAPSFSQAKKVIALGDSQKFKSFSEHLKVFPQKTALTEALIFKKIAAGDQQIVDKYELAVKGLLFEDLTPSVYLFKEIADLKSSFLFSKVGRDLISESHYRLANLERLKMNFWVKEALLFNKTYAPSSKIFNPQIMDSFKNQSENIKNYHYLYNTKKLHDENTHLFINGSLVDGSTYLHPSASYKITAFKDGFEKFSLSTAGKDISGLKKIKLKPLNLGNCHKPRFNSYQGVEIDEIFFSKKCIRKKSDHIAAQIKIAADAKLDSKLGSQLNSKRPYKRALPLGPMEAPKKKSLFKRPSTWYVTAGIVVATAIVLYINNEQNKDVRIEPVHY